MTTVRRRRRAETTFDMADLVEAFKEFRAYKRQEATAKTLHERIRDTRLMPLLERFGHAHGETGAHRAIELPEPIDGYVRVVRRTNVSQRFDVDAAEELARAKNVLPAVQTATLTIDDIPADEVEWLRAAVAKAELERFGEVTVSVRLDQDKVYKQHALGTFSDAEIDALIVEDVRYSLNPEKA